MLTPNRSCLYTTNITIAVILLLFLSGCSIPLKTGYWNDGGTIQSFSIVEKLLLNNQKVSIAMLAGQVYYQGNPSVSDRDLMLTYGEDAWLRHFINFPNFSVVNRNNIQNILNEMRFQYSGLISDSTRIKIGELTGATHLLILEAQMWKDLYTSGQIFYMKLIDIQSGRLLSVDKAESSRFL